MMRFAAALLIAVAACSSPGATIGEGWKKVLDTPPGPIEALDILFVIDNSGSMYNDQYALVTAAGDQLFAQLEAELGGMPDLHVGVISTDLGAGNYDISGCAEPGDNGRLLKGPPDGPECPGITGNFLSDVDDGQGGRLRNYQGALVDNFACLGRLGIEGCGFEQPLEAMKRALDGSNPENTGFMRPDALLLIAFLGDEDDCSAYDTGLFDTSQTELDSPLGPVSSYRCFEFGVVCDVDNPRVIGDKTGCEPREDSAYITPLADYVAFLDTLKPDPALVMLAGIVPPPGPVKVQVSDAQWFELAPACTPPPIPCPPEEPNCVQGPVQPAVRLDAIIHSFPTRYAFEPMCDDTMAAMLNRIARSTAGVMAADTCILGDNPLPADPTCRAFDVLGDARTAIPPCGDGDATCFAIVQDADRCGYTPSNLRVDVQRAAPPPTGTRLLVECLPGS